MTGENEYEITIVTRDGKTEISSVSGNVPEGHHTIKGADDSVLAKLGVVRRDGLGRFVVAANHEHSRHDYPVPFAGFAIVAEAAELAEAAQESGWNSGTSGTDPQEHGEVVDAPEIPLPGPDPEREVAEDEGGYRWGGYPR